MLQHIHPAMSLVRRAFRVVAQPFDARRYGTMSREEAFRRVYRTNAWGGTRGEHHSGRGSDDRFGVPYAWAVRDFLHDIDARSVVDLGCGDFRVGALLTAERWTYTGVEIVDEVVQSNRRRFGSDRVAFVRGDICEGDLPPGDVGLVRQVLQHLTNDDIQRALHHLRAYPYVMVTEHLPAVMARANIDQRRGPGIRTARGSGVVLHEPPFSWSPGECLVRMPVNWSGSQVLVTTVYTTGLDINAEPGEWYLDLTERVALEL